MRKAVAPPWSLETELLSYRNAGLVSQFIVRVDADGVLATIAEVGSMLRVELTIYPARGIVCFMRASASVSGSVPIRTW